MPIDPKLFRRTMGLFATGVTVVATQVGDDVHGMTANAVTSLSLDPPLVIVCVAKKARLASYLNPSGVQTTAGSEGAGGTLAIHFSVNILRQDQQALSTYFAGAWKETSPPPFRFVPWEEACRLEGCAAALACRQHAVLEGGDHWIVIGRVDAIYQGVEPRRPLVFFAGRYCHLDLAETDPAPDLNSAKTAQLYYDPWQQ